MLQSFLEEDYNRSLTRMAAPVSFESIICMSTTLTILDNGTIHSPVHVSSWISQLARGLIYYPVQGLWWDLAQNGALQCLKLHKYYYTGHLIMGIEVQEWQSPTWVLGGFSSDCRKTRTWSITYQLEYSANVELQFKPKPR